MSLYTNLKVLTFLTIYLLSLAHSKTSIKDTNLLMTHMIHRHGDRTPIEDHVMFSDNPEALKKLIEPYGYEQLTPKGMQRGYNLGKFIRRRYNNLLSKAYNSSEIYIRSTDVTRTKMTVLTAMAAVFPPGQLRWSNDINWNPVPYTTRPTSTDNLFSYASCPTFQDYVKSILYSSSAEMEPYAYLMNILSKELAIDLDCNGSNELYLIYDLFVSQINLGLPLKASTALLMPMIKEAAEVAIELIFGNPSVLARSSGTLLQEFYDVSAKIVAGEPVERVRIYSAHDISVLSMTAATKVLPRPGVPKYGSAFALELRQVKATGQYVVLPVYLNTPEEKETYLTVDGCGDVLCDLDKFIELTSEFALSETEWNTLCGN